MLQQGRLQGAPLAATRQHRRPCCRELANLIGWSVCAAAATRIPTTQCKSAPPMQLLAWAVGRGSLTHPLTLPQWLAVYALPLIPADGQSGFENG